MGGPLDHIGRACKEARDNARLHQIDIAVEAGTTDATISRFEKGVVRAPHRLDVFIAAYARETDRTELQLWMRAIELWQSEI